MRKIVDSLFSYSPFIYSIFKKNTDLYRFAIYFITLVGLWKVAFAIIWRTPYLLDLYNNFSLGVIDLILNHCGILLKCLSYKIEIISADRLLRIPGTLGVTVGEPCIGFDLMALYTALIISYKGTRSDKITYVIFGLVIIHFINIIRICALSILVSINSKIWELNHKVIFTLIVYSVIFMLWKKWIIHNTSLSK
ncbi:MAG: archaeosortase/exosortase family protein [Flavobacteriales bacterium]|nr:archaeosortase/exosortase family protein [Flavobacteriales bacterium]